MRYGKVIIAVFICILIFFVAALFALYNEIRERTVNDLNINQMVHARQAALGIRDHIGSILNTLEFFAQLEEIIVMRDEGKRIIKDYQSLHTEEVKGITRVDASGRIIYTVPYKAEAIGRDISSQEHVREILQTHKTVISDVFMAVQGFRTIAIHVPVFRDRIFDGTIAFLISFDTLAQRYIENIKIGKSGYAWVISKKGIEISCPVPGHVGRSVYETCRDFPSIISMARDMMEGKKGITTYQFDRIRGKMVEKATKHAVYLPIPIGNTFWSIVIATPEDEVMASMAGFRTKFTLVMAGMIVFSVAFTYLLVKSQIILKEQKKRDSIIVALQESEKKYRALIETTLTGFVIVDHEGIVTDANPEYVRLTGYKELKDIAGRSVMEWTAPHERKKNEEAVRQCFEKGYVRNLEIDYMDATGRITPIEINATVVEMGGQKRILTLCRDISERKQADEALRQSEAKYRLLTEKMEDIVWTTDLNFVVTYSSPSVEKILGFTIGERMNQSVMDRLTPESLRTVEELMKTQLQMEMEGSADPSRTVRIELEYYRKDGSTVWMENLISAIRDDGGRMIGIHGVSRDITERKSAEEERERLQMQLMQAQKMESIGRLAGGVAHDFNNILQAILGYSEMGLMKADPTDPLYHTLQEINKAGRRSAALTRQLLAFARKQVANPKVLDLNDTVSGMLKMLQRLIGEDIDLVLIPGHGLWNVKMDPSQLDQILANLVVNARDAIERSGRITIESANVIIDKAFCAEHLECVPGEYVKLSVEDTGCGMDLETLSSIFEPFFTTKAVGEGTGLGLATVYGIVKQNEGFITIDSEPGVGSKFTIHFPRAVDNKPAVPADRADEALPRGTETVLIVEDSEVVLKLGVRILEGLGYKVLSANSPAEAVKLAGGFNGTIDLLLTDVVMPEINGRELAERLVSMRPGLRCLFMSGYTADVMAHHGVLDMDVMFIQKPFSMRNLAIKVREALKKAQVQ